MKLDWLRILTFFLFAMSIQYLQYQIYLTKYLDSFSRIQGYRLNISTYHKDKLWWLANFFGYPLMTFWLYMAYYKFKIPLVWLVLFFTYIYQIWDLCPAYMLDNAFKELPILLFDAFFSGGFWVLITIPLFNYFSKSLTKNIIVVFFVWLVMMLITMYRLYIYNRKFTKNNYLVKLGNNIVRLINTSFGH